MDMFLESQCFFFFFFASRTGFNLVSATELPANWVMQ